MTILVSIQQPVTAWQIPAAAVERLRARCPQHTILHATTPEARADGLRVCDIAFTWVLTPAELATAGRLTWLHSSAVAVGTLKITILPAGYKSPVQPSLFLAALTAAVTALPILDESATACAWLSPSCR